jgi:hypothetical protein
MDEEFELPVVFDNKQYHFKARLLQFPLTHKFQVDVNGIEVLFEPDEERNYRAWIDPANQETLTKVNPHLLKEIALAIEYTIR